MVQFGREKHLWWVYQMLIDMSENKDVLSTLEHDLIVRRVCAGFGFPRFIH